MGNFKTFLFTTWYWYTVQSEYIFAYFSAFCSDTRSPYGTGEYRTCFQERERAVLIKNNYVSGHLVRERQCVYAYLLLLLLLIITIIRAVGHVVTWTQSDGGKT